MVRYWEEFGTIAFDPDHDSLLTACTLKSPDETKKQTVTNCCFSFMIRRDELKLSVVPSESQQRYSFVFVSLHNLAPLDFWHGQIADR